jgi:hypothetical protein
MYILFIEIAIYGFWPFLNELVFFAVEFGESFIFLRTDFLSDTHFANIFS